MKGCECCKLANMTNELRRTPSRAILRDMRVKLSNIKRYEHYERVCPEHEGKQWRGSAMVMEHWMNRIEGRVGR